MSLQSLAWTESIIEWHQRMLETAKEEIDCVYIHPRSRYDNPSHSGINVGKPDELLQRAIIEFLEREIKRLKEYLDAEAGIELKKYLDDHK